MHKKSFVPRCRLKHMWCLLSVYVRCNVDFVEIAIRILASTLPHLGRFLGLGGQTPPAIRELPPVSTRLDRAQVVTVKFPTPDNRK